MEDKKEDINLLKGMRGTELRTTLKRNTNVDFSSQEREIDESFKDLDLKIAIIKEKAMKLKKNIKTSK